MEPCFAPRALLTVFALFFAFSCREAAPPSAEPEVAEAVADHTAPKENKPIALNGAGATFPYPVYAKWAHTYQKVSGTEINYQSIGSGGGIAQIKAQTVDFGATDAPLTKEDLDVAGLLQFPMVVGGVVPVVNLEGIRPGALSL